MNVIVLCTGRNGSVTFIKACKNIRNFSSGHESRSRIIGANAFDYPENHIEADNRLSWQLGTLNKKYGDDAFYVHLKRDREKTAKSFYKRFNYRGSIVKSFCEGVKITPVELLDRKEKLDVCYDYVDVVTDNIECFLGDKSKKMTMHIENFEEEFELFWKQIGAEGDLNKALNELRIRHNSSNQVESSFTYNLKLFFYRIYRRFQ